MQSFGIQSNHMNTKPKTPYCIVFLYILSSFLLTLGYAKPLLAEPISQAQILEKIEAMQKEINSLKSELAKQKNTAVAVSASVKKEKELPLPSKTPSMDLVTDQTKSPSAIDPGLFGITYRSTGYKSNSLQIGAYGETKFGRQQTSDGWRNGFDASRVVLLGTYEIEDSILFNTEIEFEHGGIAKASDDKLDGAVEIEQLFVDFKVNDYFTWRSPGVDVVPVGYIGLFHEPTQFYSVDRPEIYNGLIPSTWFAGSTSAYGKITDGLTYQFQINSGLEDAGNASEESDGTVNSGGYSPGISGLDALGNARSSISDRKQLNDTLGYALRLAYSPQVIPGLQGSTSFFFTPDVTPRGAYGTNPNGSERHLGSSNVGMFDTELRYRPLGSGLELHAEYADVRFGNTDNLRANNNGNATDNVGKSMYAYSFETAYHFPLSKSKQKPWDLVPFYRYTFQNLQTGGVLGTDNNNPTGAGKLQYHTFGFALYPTSKLVLKLDYQLIRDEATDSPRSDSLLGGVGFFF